MAFSAFCVISQRCSDAIRRIAPVRFSLFPKTTYPRLPASLHDYSNISAGIGAILGWYSDLTPKHYLGNTDPEIELFSKPSLRR